MLNMVSKMKNEFSDQDLINSTTTFCLFFKDQMTMVYKKESLKNIRSNKAFLDTLKNECGIYYFVQNQKVKYVGRALPSVGLRSRVLNQINAYGDPKWDEVIKDDETEIGVIIFKKESWYFISALEHYLIEKLDMPIFNKRC